MNLDESALYSPQVASGIGLRYRRHHSIHFEVESTQDQVISASFQIK